MLNFANYNRVLSWVGGAVAKYEDESRTKLLGYHITPISSGSIKVKVSGTDVESDDISITPFGVDSAPYIVTEDYHTADYTVFDIHLDVSKLTESLLTEAELESIIGDNICDNNVSIELHGDPDKSLPITLRFELYKGDPSHPAIKSPSEYLYLGTNWAEEIDILNQYSAQFDELPFDYSDVKESLSVQSPVAYFTPYGELRVWGNRFNEGDLVLVYPGFGIDEENPDEDGNPTIKVVNARIWPWAPAITGDTVLAAAGECTNVKKLDTSKFEAPGDLYVYGLNPKQTPNDLMAVGISVVSEDIPENEQTVEGATVSNTITHIQAPGILWDQRYPAYRAAELSPEYTVYLAPAGDNGLGSKSPDLVKSEACSSAAYCNKDSGNAYTDQGGEMLKTSNLYYLDSKMHASLTSAFEDTRRFEHLTNLEELGYPSAVTVYPISTGEYIGGDSITDAGEGFYGSLGFPLQSNFKTDYWSSNYYLSTHDVGGSAANPPGSSAGESSYYTSVHLLPMSGGVTSTIQSGTSEVRTPLGNLCVCSLRFGNDATNYTLDGGDLSSKDKLPLIVSVLGYKPSDWLDENRYSAHERYMVTSTWELGSGPAEPTVESSKIVRYTGDDRAYASSVELVGLYNDHDCKVPLVTATLGRTTDNICSGFAMDVDSRFQGYSHAYLSCNNSYTGTNVQTRCYTNTSSDKLPGDAEGDALVMTTHSERVTSANNIGGGTICTLYTTSRKQSSVASGNTTIYYTDQCCRRGYRIIPSAGVYCGYDLTRHVGYSEWRSSTVSGCRTRVIDETSSMYVSFISGQPCTITTTYTSFYSDLNSCVAYTVTSRSSAGSGNLEPIYGSPSILIEPISGEPSSTLDSELIDMTGGTVADLRTPILRDEWEGMYAQWVESLHDTIVNDEDMDKVLPWEDPVEAAYSSNSTDSGYNISARSGEASRWISAGIADYSVYLRLKND